MPSHHTTFFYSIATSGGEGGFDPVSPNKGEQAMSTEQQGSCVTIELLNQTSKMYQDISKERREGGRGNVFSFQSISNIGQSHNRDSKIFQPQKSERHCHQLI